MNYEQAGQAYVDTEREMATLEAAHKALVAPLKEKLVVLEQWITAKAQEDGLENVKTSSGTAYWSTHHKAAVAARDSFFQHVRETGSWDLVEARASKSAVQSYVAAHGVPPPGVDFGSVRVFNFRRAAVKDKD